MLGNFIEGMIFLIVWSDFPPEKDPTSFPVYRRLGEDPMKAFRGVSFRRTSVCRFACPPRPDAAGFGVLNEQWCHGFNSRAQGSGFS